MSVLLAVCAQPRSAQAQSPPLTPQFLNEQCIVSVLNRNVRANPDGTWVLPNVPANFGPVRARATCVIDGRTVSGESEPFEVPANGAVNIPEIVLGETTPIPTALTITAQTSTLTAIGDTVQLSVSARFPDASVSDVTTGAGTSYGVSNPAIATVSANGLVQAVASGTVIIQATLEGAGGIASIRVALSGRDTDGDGVPDADELALGMNPNNPVDGMEDFDRDDLSNRDEYLQGTQIRNADTDGDGLDDGREVALGTSPLVQDSDADGVRDGLEVQTGSNPLDPNSYNLAGALSSLRVAPQVFTLTYNTIAGEASVPLQVTGTLLDETTIDLTPTQRGTNYSSSDVDVCSFGASPGRVFAGASGSCAITVTVGGFNAIADGTVVTFAPIPLSSVGLAGPGNGVDVSGDVVYVAAGAAGLQVVDASDRNAPVVIATLNLLGVANDVKLEGTRAFVAAGSAGLHIVDVSDPAALRLLGSVDTPGTALDVRARGNFAYLADGAGGLQVIDVSNAAAPRIVGSVAMAAQANGVDVAESVAVVAVGPAGVQIVSLANPASPIIIGTVDTPGDALDVVVRGSYAYVADWTGSLRAVDFTVPTASLLGSATSTALGGILQDVAAMDPFVFGADIFFVNGVPIVDASEVNDLRPRAILNFPGDATGLGIAVDGSYVYLGTDVNRLYIGQYRIRQDTNGQPPVVSIEAPAAETIFVVGETITISVSAVDDVAVTGVALTVDGSVVATDTTSPYRFSLIAQASASGTLTLGATAGDLGNNTGVAGAVAVNVIPDPLTTAEGRVVLQDGVPGANAAVTCGAGAAAALGDGRFSIANLPTVQPNVACTARYVSPDGTVLGGVSAPVVAVRGGVTEIGDLVIAPVPIIASISPKVIDATRPPASLQVTGSNLVGSTFSFVPDVNLVTIVPGSEQIDPDGTSASIAVTVVPTARGRFTLVGSNPFGGGSAVPTPMNTLTVINAQDEVDSDGDEFPDGLELLFGSDPFSAQSQPDLAANGDSISAMFSTVNLALPASERGIVSATFSVVNRFSLLTLQELVSSTFSIVNRFVALPPQDLISSVVSVVNKALAAGNPQQVVSGAFSVLNSMTLSVSQAEEPAVDALQTGTRARLAADAPTPDINQSAAGFRVVSGQALVVGVNTDAGQQTDAIEFLVNGVSFGADATPPYELAFTVPAGVDNLSFAIVATDASGNRVTGPSASVPVDADPLTRISGRVVDAAGNPIAGAIVEVVSEGLDAEFFDMPSAPDSLPDLSGLTPTRGTRITALNVRNPSGIFGADPHGSSLMPDFVGRFSGLFTVATAGAYTFFLGAGEGARLTIGGVPLVELAAASGQFQERSSTVDLQPGAIPIEVIFYQGSGAGELQLSVAPPNVGREVVSPFMLVPGGESFQTTTDETGAFAIQGVPTALQGVQVKASVTQNGQTIVGLSNRVAPVSRVGVNIGEITIVRPQR